MGKLPKSVVRRMVESANMQQEVVKLLEYRGASKIVVRGNKEKQTANSFRGEIVKINIGPYYICNFPNLDLWVKAKQDLVNEIEGYQPEYNALRPVSTKFVEKVIAAKIQNALNF